MSQSVSGLIDASGHLKQADTRLLELQQRAGGRLGGAIAVPQLAGLARLAQNLGILVSRTVRVAEGKHDLELIVRAKQDGEDISLEIAGWDVKPPLAARFGADMSQKMETLTGEKYRLWECDDALKLTYLSEPTVARNVIGMSIIDVFRLVENELGDFPIVSGLAARRGFHNQAAVLREHEEEIVLISGLPVIDNLGVYKGWRGCAALQSTADFQEETGALEVAVSANTSYAHQLNNALRKPLEQIIAQADGISGQGDGEIEPHYIEYANDIAAAGRHLLGLVEGLNDVQTIETQDFNVENHDVDLAEIARQAANLLRVRATNSNIRIDAPFDDERMIARGDYRRILQILVNLLSNAVRYSPEHSTVWLRLEQEADLAAVIIADQGKGIPADAHERIFEKFARLDPNEPNGTGLGLYISRRLARAMGGDITVDSLPGQGARFVLTLPMGQ